MPKRAQRLPDRFTSFRVKRWIGSVCRYGHGQSGGCIKIEVDKRRYSVGIQGFFVFSSQMIPFSVCLFVGLLAYLSFIFGEDAFSPNPVPKISQPSIFGNNATDWLSQNLTQSRCIAAVAE